MEVLFVNTKYLKDNTGVEQNVDDSKILPYIRKSQHNHIMNLLGESFYNHLINATINLTLTTAENTFIRNFIQPCLAEYAYYEVYPFLGIKTTNKGQSKENSEWSNNADLNEMKYMRNAIKDMADLYAIRLKGDLRRGFDAGEFPLAKQIFGDNPVKSTKGYFNGVYLDTDIRRVKRPDSSPIKRYGIDDSYYGNN